MIAKISSTANLGGALGYNFKKVVSGEASILLAEGLYTTPESGYTMDEVLSDMQALIPKKCRTKNVVFHCSINPHPDEKLSDEQLAQIAGEYMQALAMATSPTSYLSITTSPVNISTSYRYVLIASGGRLTTDLRTDAASESLMP